MCDMVTVCDGDMCDMVTLCDGDMCDMVTLCDGDMSHTYIFRVCNKYYHI